MMMMMGGITTLMTIGITVMVIMLVVMTVSLILRYRRVGPRTPGRERLAPQHDNRYHPEN